MKLSQIYVKVVEIYKVGKKIGIPDESIGKLEILQYGAFSKQLEHISFRIDMAKERGLFGRDFISLSRGNWKMCLEELNVMFNSIRNAGHQNSLNDLQTGKLLIQEVSFDKSKLIEVEMDLELVKVSGKENYFVQKTEMTKSGLIIN